MTEAFKGFVEKIVQQIEGNQQEKDDLYEELMIHLELSKEESLQEGLSVKEAEKKAMAQFGDETVVGDQIQQAMFPYRKEMMMLLAIGSMLFSIGVYLAQLFIEGDAYILWLILSIGVSTSLFAFSIQSIAFMNRRLWMNSLLLVHIAIYLVGILLASDLTVQTISAPLTIFVFLLLILALALIYRTTIHDYKASDHPLPKHAKRLHVLNITAGVGVIGFCLFMIWGILVMTGMISPVLMIPLVPFIIWIGLYIWQMNAIHKLRIKTAYAVASVPMAVILIMLGYLGYILFG